MSLPPLVEPAADLTGRRGPPLQPPPDHPRRRDGRQRRLKNAKVLCVGAGGLGSPVLMYLAAAGVGTLGIVEFDAVDESNLQRQIIHGQATWVGSKAESARDAIMEINPLDRRPPARDSAGRGTERAGDLRRLRPDRRRHRQFCHALSGQRRVRVAEQAERVGRV